jgi:hypothetical protein
MVLTKKEMIPPTRDTIETLQELVDNRRQIRAREYERTRRKITQYERLEDAQKPLINVLKGLLEDRNTWDIQKLANGRVIASPFSWQNISPLLQQLNRMDNTEAVETINDLVNKIPNSLSTQRGNLQKLAALFAQRHDGGLVTVDDLDREGLLGRLGATRLTARPARQRPQTDDGAGDAAQPPLDAMRPILYPREDREDIPPDDPLQPPKPIARKRIYGQEGLSPSVDLDIRDRLGERRLPIPDITPASGADTDRLGLAPTDEELVVNNIAEGYRDFPQILAMTADMAGWSRQRVDELIGIAEDIAETEPIGREALSREDVSHLRGSVEGRLLEQMVENLRESEDMRNPAVQKAAYDKLEEFRAAYRLSNDIRSQPGVEQFIRTNGTLPYAEGTPPQRGFAPAQPTASIPLPYREGATGVSPLLGQIAGIESGRQPFRAGIPAVQTYPEPSPAMGTLSMIRTGEQRPPLSSSGDYIPTLPSDSPTEELTQRVDELRSLIPPSDLALAQSESIPPQTTYATAQTQTRDSSATITQQPDGAVMIMGKRLPPDAITPNSITFRGKTVRYSPNVWKVFTLNDPRSIRLLDLNLDDDEKIREVAALLGYKGWNNTSSKYRNVARTVLPSEESDFDTQLRQTRRDLSRGRMPVESIRGRRPGVSAEGRTEDLDDTALPEAWTARGFDAGIGSGMPKKWNPLKLGSKGEIGEIEVSLPHLLEKMELVVKRRNGGKVMMRRKGVPIDLVRLLTRRFNPKVNYTDESKDLYKKIIGLSKVPLGQSHSRKEHIMGTGLKVPENTSTIDKAVAEADPDRVIRGFMTDLGTFRNGNRGKVLKNNISQKADFLLEHDILSDKEHKLVHSMITSKGRKLSATMEEFMNDLLN